jgi:F-type H+-transporting ATPase subunit b
MRALAFALCLLVSGPAFAQGGWTEYEPYRVAQSEVDPVDHAGIEGGGHGEHSPGGHHGAAPPPPINWYQWHTGKDLYGGELHPAEEPMPPGVLFALLNFAVFVGLLIKFAGPKLGVYLRTRHELVKGQLEEAARLRAEARAKLDEYNRRIAAVDAEVTQLMSDIRAEAEAEKEMILGQARSQAEAMKRDAARRIESEIARARGVLEREVATAAVAAAEKILRERTTPDDQSRMFDTFVDALVEGPGGGGGRAKRESTVDEEWS